MAGTIDTGRVRGCILGAALGDSMGAPFEFWQAPWVASENGSTWISTLRPCGESIGAHGIWEKRPPLGTGTDDTRYNWLLLELAGELGRMPTGQEVARRFLEVADNPERFFPRHADMAREQFAAWTGMCYGAIGQADPRRPGVPALALLDGSIGGLNFPTLIGLITFTCAGVLFPGRPDEAYRAVYQADFCDVGYAREAVSLLAAAVCAGVAGSAAPVEIIRQTEQLDPFTMAGCFGGPFIEQRLAGLLKDAADRRGEELAEFLSRQFRHMHVFDPFRTLATAFAAVQAHPSDPMAAIQVAVNQRAVSDAGELSQFLDIDCYACVTGALAGATAGESAFPAELLRHVIEANRAAYGIDLEKTIDRVIARTASDSP